MARASALAALILALIFQTAEAGMIDISATQTGGFYDGGATPNNLPGFQNYFVGYGTTPGFDRAAERRSFFVFDLAGLSFGEIESATLTLRLPTPGGLHFGAGPGDPELGPLPLDPFETFALGLTMFPTEMVLSVGLPEPDIDSIFESFDDHPVADPFVFTTGVVPLLESDIFGAKVVIALNAFGISALNFKAGSTIVLTGWMPSWSFDTRIVPGSDPPEFLEGSELIFGLTDVKFPPPPGVPAPVLTLSLSEDASPVPEPASWGLLALGLTLVSVGRAWKRRTAVACS